MNKGILSLAILASVSMGLSASNAHKSKKGSREGRSPMKELNLTADQQTQIQSLRESYQVKRKDLSEAYNKDVEKILTPEQKTKWEAKQKQRAEHISIDRRGGKKGKRGARARAIQPQQTTTTQG